MKLAILILLLSSLSLLSEKILSFIGTINNATQDCRPFLSLVDGRVLTFTTNLDENQSPLYDREIFELAEFVMANLHRVFEYHLPLFVITYVYLQIERTETARMGIGNRA